MRLEILVKLFFIFMLFSISLFSVFSFNILNNTKISDNLSGFYPTDLVAGDRFGSGIANIGDMDGNGVSDLAVGAFFDEYLGSGDGALYILFMEDNGSVKNYTKIADSLNNFYPSTLDNGDYFGYSVTNIGDMDSNGVVDLAVGASSDENGDSSEGALYILFMESNGSVKNHTKISDGLNGFYPSDLNVSDSFGYSVANIGDMDSNGVVDLAVGAYQDENLESGEGSIYILFMESNGSVKNHTKISDGLNNFLPSNLNNGDYFGACIANIGDMDGNGVVDLAVGAYQDENDDSSEGALYILFMESNGSVKNHTKISDGLNGFYPSDLNVSDSFGYSVANIGDMDSNGVVDLAVGAIFDENLESDEGALYILFMESNGSVKNHTKISDGLSGFYPSGLDSGDRFGFSIANIGDFNGDGFIDLGIGAILDENLESGEGAIYILFTNYTIPIVTDFSDISVFPLSSLFSVLFGIVMVLGYFLFA